MYGENLMVTAADATQARLFLDAQSAALQQLEGLALAFGSDFPDDTTAGGAYPLRRYPGMPDGANTGWTTGLWTGMAWLAHELSGRDLFRDWAQSQHASFAARLAGRIDLEHHDLGFLYGQSVAGYGITGEARHRDLALEAAQVLAGRFLPAAGVIQAWGRIADSTDQRDQGRIIIDTLMNLPLLHWASARTGEARYGDVARAHLARTVDLLLRPDGSSAHSCHIDLHNGALLRVSTVQGHASGSCWARGQAWGVYGLALNHRHAPGLQLLDAACHMAEHLLACLPDDGVCQWDLALDWRGGEQRDSSASAIAVCGLLELASQLPPGARSQRYREAALHMLQGLVTTCADQPGAGRGLLSHGVYSMPEGRGVDEANLWGDYYYLEALARVNTGWRSYWHGHIQPRSRPALCGQAGVTAPSRDR